MAKITDKWRKATDIDVASPTQFSLRPSVRMTAQIHALMKMFPGQNKTDLINDLLKVGIKQAVEEILGDQEYFNQTGDSRENASDYKDEDAKQFVTYFQAEVASLLQQVDDLSKKKGAKKEQSDS